jgi:hypothetical protein
MSGIALLAVLASFFLPLLLAPGLLDRLAAMLTDRDDGNYLAQAAVLAVTFAFYFICYFIIVYFNTALTACAIDRFKGGDPTIRTGLQLANQRLPQIAGWALLAASVGMLLKMIEQRSEWIGRIVVSILGGLWSLASFLVVPTLAVEGLGPTDALKRSISLIREVWGESMAGNFQIGLIGFLLTLPAVVLVVVLLAWLQPPLPVVGVIVGVGVLYVLAVSVATTAVSQVFIASLYVYATENRVPRGFRAESLRSAFSKTP